MKKSSDEGRAFYRAIIGNRKTANVLICCFAMPYNQWQTGYNDDMNKILSINDGVSLSFQNANLDNFIDQVAWADVIIFRGGSISNLMDNLKKVQGWQDHLFGKTIVGSSAGAYVLSSSYVVTDTTPQLASGLGLLPIVIVTHYRSVFIHSGDIDTSKAFWDSIDNLMRTQANGRDVITLKEGEFINYTGR
jgi:peptidase E